MKTSLPQQLFIYCAVICIGLSCFQMGATYGAKPYRELGAPTAQGLRFTEVAVQQSNTLLRVSWVALGVNVVGFVSLLWGSRRRNEPVHFAAPSPGRGA